MLSSRESTLYTSDATADSRANMNPLNGDEDGDIKNIKISGINSEYHERLSRVRLHRHRYASGQFGSVCVCEGASKYKYRPVNLLMRRTWCFCETATF